jgi:superfamily II RNA helicase
MNRTVMLMVVVMILGISPALSQPGRRHEGRPMERVERLRKVRLIEFLGLQEEQSARFIARLNEHEKARRDLFNERSDVLDKLDTLLENKAEAPEIEKRIAEVESINARIAEENQKFYAGLSDILSVEQRAKVLLFERRFERELREAIRDVQRRRPGEGTQ